MRMNPYQVVDVAAVGNRRLAVRFADGLSGEIEFRESFFHGVFQPIKDPDLFAQVTCSQGFVEWPGDLDLAPDAMYAAIKAYGRWVME
jgi:hypothetical protein